METIQVIRFENERGTGIFRGKLYIDDESGEYTGMLRRHGDFPTPHEDYCEETGGYLSMKKDGAEWFCAYKDVPQLQKWIMPDEIKFLVSVGFRIYLLTVSDFQIGEYQAIFTKESIVTKEDITNIF